MIKEEDLRLRAKRLYEFIGFEILLEKESSLEYDGEGEYLNFERLEKLFGGGE
jgi:hypothetical protein